MKLLERAVHREDAGVGGIGQQRESFFQLV